MKKTIKIQLIVAVYLVSSMLILSSKGSVSAAPFICQPGFYQSTIFGSFKKLNPVDGSYQDIGNSSATSLNAIGYNVEDNYIYGINNDSNDNLVRLEHDATTTNLGTPSGLTAGNYVSGDMDHSGNLYVTDGADLWTIDVSANSATSMALSTSVPANDLVYIDGFLYGTNGTSLFEIDVDTAIVATRALGLPAGVYGAGWATAENKLYFGSNASGIIYEVESYGTLSPTFKPALTGESGLIGNDGASCSLAASVIIPIAAGNDSYKVTVGGSLNIPAGTGLLSNDVPEGVTVDSYTQPGNGNVTVNSDGSFTYTPNPGFVGTDSFTYTIINSVGETATATVTIQVADDSSSAGQLAETGTPSVTESIISAVFIVVSLSLGMYSRKLRTTKYL